MNDVQSLIEELRFSAENGSTDAELLKRAVPTLLALLVGSSS